MIRVRQILFILAAFYTIATAQVISDTSSQVELPSTGVDFSLDVMSGNAPLEVNVAVTERPEGEGWSYSWIFNDGPLVEGAQATHVYKEPGEYNIILIVKRAGEMKTSTHIVNVNGEGEVRKIQVPLSVNYSDFPGAWQIVGLAGQAYLDSATSVPARFDRSTGIAVYDREGNLLTSDRVLPGLKDFVRLDAETSVKIQVFDMMGAIGLQSTEGALALKRIEQHPRFLEAVELTREEKRTFGSDDFNDAIYEIQSEIANDILKDFYEAKVIPPNYP